MKGSDTGLNKKYKLPFIFLIFYGDKHTIDLAKITDPAGYLGKPFQAVNLYASLHMAMHLFLSKYR